MISENIFEDISLCGWFCMTLNHGVVVETVFFLVYHYIAMCLLLDEFINAKLEFALKVWGCRWSSSLNLSIDKSLGLGLGSGQVWNERTQK